MDIKNIFGRTAAGILASGAINSVRDIFRKESEAYAATSSDPPFATYSMPVKRSQYRARARVSRRKVYPSRVIRRNLANDVIPMRRTSQPIDVGGVGSTLTYNTNIKLNMVPTTDLIGSYQCYRIRKVVAEIQPNFDAANGGVGQNYVTHVYAANDVSGATPSWSNIVSIGNYKYSSIPSGKKMLYTFYPKAENVIQGASATVSAGTYGTNTWIQLNADGVGVPHYQFLLTVINAAALSLSNDVVVTFTIYFDVKRTR